MKFFNSYDHRAFSINLHVLNIAEVCPKYFIWTWKKHFSWRKISKQVTDKVHKKVQKKVHKNFFHFAFTNVNENSIFLFDFLVIWLSVKYKIFSSLATFLECFKFLFYSIRTNWKCNTKVQHVCCALKCWTFMLHFF